ncbi:hypothetical protein R3P38DRAFT_2796139 [Favolaschia claudopus]|uniref:NACHT domain-containing protein n=1 Tax=Favolaschia claudopus TaxID=2862362 RepID=A0AAW0A633_9AGAR
MFYTDINTNTDMAVALDSVARVEWAEYQTIALCQLFFMILNPKNPSHLSNLRQSSACQQKYYAGSFVSSQCPEKDPRRDSMRLEAAEAFAKLEPSSPANQTETKLPFLARAMPVITTRSTSNAREFANFAIVESSYLRKLRPAHYDEELRDGCLQGTRKDTVTEITARLASRSETSNIIWLYGVAGCGKSALASTVAQFFRNLHQLGSFVFFKRDDASNSDVVGVVHHIAHRIAESNTHVRKALCDALAADATLTDADYRTQFQKLLVEPLTAAAPYICGPVVIVIDALDEYLHPPSRKALISLIASDMAKLPPPFRLLVTSRPDMDIVRAFRSGPHIASQQVEIGTEDATKDILLYLRQRIDTRCRDRQVAKSDWPAEGDIQLLAAYTGGLFVWASTAYKFMLELDRPSMNQIQEAEKTISKNLDPMYSLALDHAGDWTYTDFALPALSVLASVVLIKEPLTEEVMTALLNDRAVRQVLDCLGCVLQWGPSTPVRALHPSFCDYLTDPKRSGARPWFLDAKIQSQFLTTRCLQLLTSKLRFNICDLSASHVKNSDIFDLADRIRQDILMTSRMLRNMGISSLFLHWLEVLSLLGHVGGASEAMAAAEKFAQGKNPHLATFLQNGIKLIGIHAPCHRREHATGIMAKYMMQFQFDVPLVQKWSILLKAPVAGDLRE